jgi:hypothetical protein
MTDGEMTAAEGYRADALLDAWSRDRNKIHTGAERDLMMRRLADTGRLGEPGEPSRYEIVTLPEANGWSRDLAKRVLANAPPPAALEFPRFDLSAFLEEHPPPPDWLLDGFLEVGELCWLAGRGKVGKSMLALFLADACLRGVGEFLGRPVGALDWVLYVDAENREKTVRRRVHLAGMGKDVADAIDYRSVRGIDLGSPAALEALNRVVDRSGRGLVILDSLVALHRADENQAIEVRQFADKLRTVFEPVGVTAVGLAHENRSGNLRGSLDWRNAADRVLELVKKEDGTRELSNGEVRDGSEDVAPAAFKFVAEATQAGTRLLLETVAGGARTITKTKADQLAEQVVLLLRGDPTLSRAKVASSLGYDRDHGTFRRAWTVASQVLATEGGQSGPA